MKEGSIVKFKDRNGDKSGGTIIEFIYERGEKYALINCVDGSRVRKRASDLTLIQRQQRGRVSAKFLEDFKNEILNGRDTADNIEMDNTDDYDTPDESYSESESECDTILAVATNDSIKVESDIDSEKYSLKRTIAELRSLVNDRDVEIEQLKGQIDDRDNIIKEFEYRLNESNSKIETIDKSKPKVITQSIDDDSMKRMRISLIGMANAIQAFSIDSKIDAVNSLSDTILKLNNIENGDK